MTRGADLSGLHDLDEVRAVLQRWAADHPAGWVLGWGLDPNVFGGAAPSLRSSMGSLPSAPASCSASMRTPRSPRPPRSGAPASRGARSSPTPPRSRSTRRGTPSGLLLEHAAIGLVQRHVPPLSFEERVEALGSILRGMAETGVTSGQMLDLSDPMPSTSSTSSSVAVIFRCACASRRWCGRGRGQRSGRSSARCRVGTADAGMSPASSS